MTTSASAREAAEPMRKQRKLKSSAAVARRSQRRLDQLPSVGCCSMEQQAYGTLQVQPKLVDQTLPVRQ